MGELLVHPMTREKQHPELLMTAKGAYLFPCRSALICASVMFAQASAVILARMLHERVHSGVFWTWASTQWQSNIFFLPSLLVLYYVIDSFADAAVK